MKPYYEDESVVIWNMDCREFDGSADVIITDPPYGLEFMGKEWDNGIPDYWQFDAGWLFAFGGTRTWHRLACAIEDSGWQYRDTIMWLYGQGFPKGKNTLKPAWEPIIVARKYGDLDIDAARISLTDECNLGLRQVQQHYGGAVDFGAKGLIGTSIPTYKPQGRWPANLVLDEEAGRLLDEQSGELASGGFPAVRNTSGYSGGLNQGATPHGAFRMDNGGGASRFFYCAKASKKDRGEGNDHPTVKPLKLMEWLIKLSGGQTILDPFMGSGTTLVAAKSLGRKAIGIEIDEHSCEIAANRCRNIKYQGEYSNE